MLSKYSYSVNMIWPKSFFTRLALLCPWTFPITVVIKWIWRWWWFTVHAGPKAHQTVEHDILFCWCTTVRFPWFQHMILPLPKDIIWSSYPFSRKYVKTCLGLWDLRRFEDLQVFHLGLNYLWSKVLWSPTEGPRSVSDHLKKNGSAFKSIDLWFPVTLAKPKSVMTTWPWRSSSRFSGFKSL